MAATIGQFFNAITLFFKGALILVIKQQNVPFYCVNTSYPMDNSLSCRRGPARQTSEKDVLCLHRLGQSSTVHSPGGVSYFLPV